MFASVAVMKMQLNACIMFLFQVVLFGLDFRVQKGIVTASTMGTPESGSFSCVPSTKGREHQHLRTTGSFLSAPSPSPLIYLPHSKPSSKLNKVKVFKEACSPGVPPLQNGSQNNNQTLSDLGVKGCSHSLTPGNT